MADRRSKAPNPRARLVLLENRALRWAREDLAKARAEVKDHRTACHACKWSACETASRLYADIADLKEAVRREQALAKAPMPGEIALFSDEEIAGLERQKAGTASLDLADRPWLMQPTQPPSERSQTDEPDP
jgi:Fe-S oxidoreductase